MLYCVDVWIFMKRTHLREKPSIYNSIEIEIYVFFNREFIYFFISRFIPIFYIVSILSHFAISHIGAYRKFRSFLISRECKSNRCLVRTYLACRLHFSRMHDAATISHDTMKNRIVTFDSKICVPLLIPIIEYTLDWSHIVSHLRTEKYDKLPKGKDLKTVDRLKLSNSRST